ncbi:E3 SUMO-protein ligase ZBED1-like, partial [Lucilia sericata]|uniref:E3 SUMO-protein ligase ZBED1-like n=1 Tax=Lucilia sericata TaxID=13632 RepID=UPI0018A839AD
MSQKRSDVWSHFTEINSESAKCNICKRVISYKGGGSSNLRKHLYSQHPTVSLKKVRNHHEDSDDETPSTSNKQMKLDDYNIRIRMSKAMEEKIHNALLQMITIDLRPLSIVENIGFQEFTKALNPDYKLPNRITLTKSLLPKVYDKRLLEVKHMLRDIDNICITTDGWTSISNESYISITAHFISPDWKQKTVFISCFKTMKDHTAQNLKDEICQVLQEWGMDSKITCVLSDNAANIVAAIKKTDWTHLSCLAHNLHLVVTDALKISEINEIIVKCKVAVEYFHRSTKASNKLKEIQNQMGKTDLKMINSTPTRWNSTLHMLERFVKNQEPLEAAVAILHNPTILPSLEEWCIIKRIIIILQPFNEITIEMSGETYTTISKVLIMIQRLQSFLIKTKSGESNEKCKIFIEKLSANINRRFHMCETNEIYSVSSFLDPRFKLKSFTDENALNICKSKINILLEEMDTHEEIELDNLLEEVLSEKSIWDDFDKESNANKNNIKKACAELEKYINEPTLERKKCPLEWWKINENKYPFLAKLANKYLAIVAT